MTLRKGERDSELMWDQVISNRPQFWASIWIAIQFAALIRCLGEYLRLKYFVVEKFSIIHVEPFIIGSLVTAMLPFAGILFYFTKKFRVTAITAVVNVVILFILRSARL
jgi:hypothetical protein